MGRACGDGQVTRGIVNKSLGVSGSQGEQKRITLYENTTPTSEEGQPGRA